MKAIDRALDDLFESSRAFFRNQAILQSGRVPSDHVMFSLERMSHQTDLSLHFMRMIPMRAIHHTRLVLNMPDLSDSPINTSAFRLGRGYTTSITQGILRH
ncbi:hypothetical protein KIN20_009863 [Parelaphostrongylus tenuis]|uniref:Uncharacterized protein n=1 Tax=Parelaphostrongylus tenuis TaxID=148309 RepID=A0AAD5MBQ8_PARTN|nr:hypothetical protein KIN20_009863 [Parelaphostrongylus tenuis]